VVHATLPVNLISNSLEIDGRQRGGDFDLPWRHKMARTRRMAAHEQDIGGLGVRRTSTGTVRAIAVCGRYRALRDARSLPRCYESNSEISVRGELGANHQDQAGRCGLMRVRGFEVRGGAAQIVKEELTSICGQRGSLRNAIWIRNRHPGAATSSARADGRATGRRRGRHLDRTKPDLSSAQPLTRSMTPRWSRARGNARATNCGTPSVEFTTVPPIPCGVGDSPCGLQRMKRSGCLRAIAAQDLGFRPRGKREEKQNPCGSAATFEATPFGTKSATTSRAA
jgi:hypothetical protein